MPFHRHPFILLAFESLTSIIVAVAMEGDVVPWSDFVEQTVVDDLLSLGR